MSLGPAGAVGARPMRVAVAASMQAAFRASLWVVVIASPWIETLALAAPSYHRTRRSDSVEHQPRRHVLGTGTEPVVALPGRMAQILKHAAVLVWVRSKPTRTLRRRDRGATSSQVHRFCWHAMLATRPFPPKRRRAEVPRPRPRGLATQIRAWTECERRWRWETWSWGKPAPAGWFQWP